MLCFVYHHSLYMVSYTMVCTVLYSINSLTLLRIPLCSLFFIPPLALHGFVYPPFVTRGFVYHRALLKVLFSLCM